MTEFSTLKTFTETGLKDIAHRITQSHGDISTIYMVDKDTNRARSSNNKSTKSTFEPRHGISNNVAFLQV